MCARLKNMTFESRAYFVSGVTGASEREREKKNSDDVISKQALPPLLFQSPPTTAASQEKYAHMTPNSSALRWGLISLDVARRINVCA